MAVRRPAPPPHRDVKNMDPKKLAALEAVKLIEPDTKVGLGAGSTIAHLTDFLAKKIEEGLRVEIFTSSDETAARLSAKGIPVSDIGRVTRLHVYLDGCDQFDRRLNALKSGGGIHTSEKCSPRWPTRSFSSAIIRNASKIWRANAEGHARGLHPTQRLGSAPRHLRSPFFLKFYSPESTGASPRDSGKLSGSARAARIVCSAGGAGCARIVAKGRTSIICWGFSGKKGARRCALSASRGCPTRCAPPSNTARSSAEVGIPLLGIEFYTRPRRRWAWVRAFRARWARSP